MMKRSLAIVTLVILTLAVPASMLAQQNSKAEQEVRAQIEVIRQMALKSGEAEAAAFYDKYNADDVVRISPDGTLNTKAQILDGLRSGNLKVELFDFSDVKILIHGKTAVVTGIESGKGTYLGTPWTGAFRWSRVLEKRNGIWKVVLYQDTPLKQ
jgi:hypothetical protein